MARLRERRGDLPVILMTSREELVYEQAAEDLAVDEFATLAGADSRSLERQIYEQLFAETNGDFAAMADKLLTGNPETNARRVRLRFNQLGLRARRLRNTGRPKKPRKTE